MKVIVSGSRDWTDKETMLLVFESLRITSIVHGDCRGADKMAKEIAKDNGIAERPYPADWSTYGKNAGPIRNRQMIDENSDAECMLVFHEDFQKSKGSRDAVNYATSKDKRIPVIIIPENPISLRPKADLPE